MMNITSSSNKIYKFIKSLGAKKGRVENGAYSVEGIKSVCEAIDSGENIRLVGISEIAYEKCLEVVDRAERKNIDVYVFSENLFESMCDTKTPEGAMCVINITKKELGGEEGLYLYCDGVADPGNAGTLIRCADAVGAKGVVFSPGSVDIYNPKTVRATMGSMFHVPVWMDEDTDFLEKMRGKGYSVVSGALRDDAKDFKTINYGKKTIMVVGNEANGISEKVLDVSDNIVIIPICGKAESLNAAVAGALLMYEWQRNN